MNFFKAGLVLFALMRASLLLANVPGGVVSGTSPNVTLTDNGSTVTLANGIVSILCTKSGATINQINYTYNNGAGSTTTQLLNGGTDGGMLYWEYGGFGGSASTYSIIVNPAVGDANHAAGDYAEIDLLSTSTSSGTVDVHFSMLRGSPGFYVTGIWSHRAVDAAMSLGETRTNIYSGSIFNWMSVDSARNKLMEVSGGTSVAVPGAPKECTLWTSGIYQGLYEDKYKYSADFGAQRAWGWSSVGTGGKNVGLWDVSASAEYYNCGPMKRELMCHIGTTILNMFNGDHYAEGTDAAFVSGEVWSKVYGPYFVYCNNVSTTNTNQFTASQALYNDALAQGAAEAAAWPYSWFYNSNYTPASGRATVTGRIVISDTGNPNASAANLWVGLVQQPLTSAYTYDFQAWMKPYQFWVQSDANGIFSIPNVIAGSNYTLYAFGPGAEGEFMSQYQTGGNPPMLYNLPVSPFGVSGTAGATTSLGVVTWTPTRVGATVFEIGYLDRTGRKFRHGDDYWVGDIGASPTAPSPVWSKYLEYPFDFPHGMNYTVGASRWTTDWDFVQPVLTSTAGGYNNSTGTITFNLASAPATGAQASLYLGLASNLSDATIVSVNGNNLGSATGVTSTPNTNDVNGYYSPYNLCDTTIREGINALFADERLTFPGALLKAGTNVITISLRQTGGSYFADHLMYDYLRLELTGYVPPAPASVTAYAGNNSVLLSWPVTPGATSYNILRSITSGTGYSSLAAGVTGPVCGSGPANGTWLDATATNGTTYYYVVRSLNTTGTSGNSPQSAGKAPSSGASASPPAVPTGLTATAGDGEVTLVWNAPAGANYYTVTRSTLVSNGGGTYNTLGTITLSNTVTGTSYTDASPTNGSTYSYAVTAANAAGSGTASAAATAVPLAPAPEAAPAGLTATPGIGQVTLAWSPVAGATGYILEVGTASGGPYTYVASVTELTYVDTGLANNTAYYYVVAATNSGGTSANSNEATATTTVGAPAGLAATPGNTQVTLNWTSLADATGYVILRGTVTGGPYTPIGVSTGVSYTDNGLTNGAPYFYVVSGSNTNGIGPDSPEASATPVSTVPVAPLALTAGGGYEQIFLNWTASSGATSYTVYRAAVTGGPYTSVASGITATSYTDTGLPDDTTYYYVVVAANSGGASANSNEASASTLTGPLAMLTWDNLGASPADPADGAGAWNANAALWSDGVADAVWNNNSNFTAVFGNGNGEAGMVTLGAVTAGGLVFNAPGGGNYTLTSGTLTLSGSVPTISANANATIGSVLSGSGAVTMDGTGTITLTSPASFTSSVNLDNVTLDLSGPNYSVMLGTGTLGFNGGCLVALTGGTNASAFSNPVYVPAGEAGNITFSTRTVWTAPSVSGSGTLNLYVSSTLGGSRDDFYTNFASFAGQVNLIGTVAGCGIRFFLFNGEAAGSSIATWNIGSAGTTVSVMPQTNSNGNTMNIGTLTGGQNGTLSGGSAGVVTYSIGASGANSTFAGSVSGKAAITKVGPGTQIISGPCAYTGATSVLDGILEITGTLSGTSSLTVGSGAVFYLAGGTLSVAGSITNNGIFKLSGTASLALTGSFINNGVLDLIDGPSTLPPRFVNNGVVLYASSVTVQQVSISGTNVNLAIQSYLTHTYQLQRTNSLTNPAWTNIGSAQTGNGSILNFTDPGGVSGAQGFYRFQVSP